MAWLWALLAGFATGILSGMGIGGGTLLVIYLVNLAGVSQLEAQGINLLYFLPTAGASLVAHIKNKLVEKQAFFWCVAVGIPAAVGGSLLAVSMDTVLLRKIFGGLLVGAGILQFIRAKK